MPASCKLDSIFELQAALMREYKTRTPDGIPDWPMDMAQKKSQRFMKDTLSKCQDELAESKYLLKRAKEHRDNDGAPLDRSEMLEEMVDALHFFVEACVLMGVSAAELADAYAVKNATNLRRIDAEFGPKQCMGIETDMVRSPCCSADVFSSDPDEFGYMTHHECVECGGAIVL